MEVDANGNPVAVEAKKKPVQFMVYSTIPPREAQKVGGSFAQKEEYVYGQNTLQAQHAADYSEEHARLLLQDFEKRGYEEATQVGEGSKWQGWGSKLTEALAKLKKTPEKQLVVLSDGYDVLVNPRKDA